MDTRRKRFSIIANYYTLFAWLIFISFILQLRALVPIKAVSLTLLNAAQN